MKFFYVMLCFVWISSHAQTPLRLEAVKSALTSRQNIEIKKHLDNYSVVGIDTRTLRSYLRQHRAQAKVTLAVPGSDELNLTLEEYDIRSSQYKAYQSSATGVKEDVYIDNCYTYKGYLNDDPAQFVRLTVTDKLIKGVLFDKSKGYLVLEPLSTFQKSNESEGKYAFYNLSSLKNSSNLCGVHAIKSVLNESKQDKARQASTLTNPCRIVEIATDADYEWYSIFGNASNFEIISIMNVVDGIYQNTFNLRMVISFQNVYTANNDPYTTNNDLLFLDQFRNHWNSNRQNIKRDLAHLFSGKTLNNSVVGVSYSGVVCANSSYSYGLTVDSYNDYYTTAHEVGHNFGANHPNEVGHPEECNPNLSIMCQGSYSSNPVFTAFSQSEVNNHLNNYSSCLFSGPPQVQQTLLGGNPIGLYSNNSVCTFNNYSLNATIVGLEGLSGNGTSWQLLNSNNGAYISTSSGSGANFYAGSSSGSFNIKLNMTNACGTSEASYFFNAAECSGYYRYTVYPNPASDYMTIEFEDSKETKNYPEQFDLIEESAYGSGQPVKTLDVREESTKQIAKNTRQLTINVKDLPRGRYILRVIKEKEQKDKQVDVIRILLE